MGFAASWGKLRRALEPEGVIARGLTSHGLRHTLGARNLVSNLNLTGKRSIGDHKVSSPD